MASERVWDSMYNEEVQRRIDCDYDGYGDGMAWTQEPDEPVSYSKRDLEIVDKLEHILKQKQALQENLRDGKRDWLYTQSGEKKSAVMPLNEGTVQMLAHTAFNLYTFYILNQPHMKEIADMLIHSLQADKENARRFEIEELRSLWERD